MAKIKQDLGQLFENNSNCYANTTDNSVVMAMDKEQFVKIVSDLLTECVLAECSDENSNCNIQNVNASYYAVSLAFQKQISNNRINFGLVSRLVKANSKEEAFGIVFDSDHDFKEHSLITKTCYKIDTSIL